MEREQDERNVELPESVEPTQDIVEQSRAEDEIDEGDSVTAPAPPKLLDQSADDALVSSLSPGASDSNEEEPDSEPQLDAPQSEATSNADPATQSAGNVTRIELPGGITISPTRPPDAARDRHSRLLPLDPTGASDKHPDPVDEIFPPELRLPAGSGELGGPARMPAPEGAERKKVSDTFFAIGRRTTSRYDDDTAGERLPGKQGVLAMFTTFMAVGSFLAIAGMLSDPDPAAEAYQRGERLSDMGHVAEAISEFTEAIRLNPEFAQPYVARALLLEKREVDTAIADCTTAVELDPTLVVGFLTRAMMLLRKGEQRRAIADLTKAIELVPDQPEAFALRGSLYAALGEPRPAIADCTEAIRQDPNIVHSYLGRARAHYDQRNFDLAIADLNKAIELDPNLGAAYNGRAAAYRRQGNTALAEQDLARAKELGYEPR